MVSIALELFCPIIIIIIIDIYHFGVKIGDLVHYLDNLDIFVKRSYQPALFNYLLKLIHDL